MRKKFKRIVPFVLVGVLASSFVMTNYNKAREAKAAFVVDDIALMVALFAMCGITYTGLEYYYANGQWLDENDNCFLTYTVTGQKYVNWQKEERGKYYDLFVQWNAWLGKIFTYCKGYLLRFKKWLSCNC